MAITFSIINDTSIIHKDRLSEWCTFGIIKVKWVSSLSYHTDTDTEELETKE